MLTAVLSSVFGQAVNEGALLATVALLGALHMIVRASSRERAGRGRQGPPLRGSRPVPLPSPTTLSTLNRKQRRRMGMDLTGEYTIEELRAQAADALGVAPGITLRLADDVTITIPHPMFVDDDVLDFMQGAQQDSSPIEMAKTLLGKDFEVLRAHGGRSADVIAAWTIMNKQMNDTAPGSGNPTR
jgi:hypothetical protein